MSLGTMGGVTFCISLSFRIFLSVNDTGFLLLPEQTPPRVGFVLVNYDTLASYIEGRARRVASASGERAKPASSSPPNRRLTARLHATARTCANMRGRT